MSQHNIIGSEAFSRGPSVIIRRYRSGGMRRRRARSALAFLAGAGIMLLIGAGAVALSFSSGLAN